MVRVFAVICALLSFLPWRAAGNDCTFTPSLNGPASACEGSINLVYTTDAGGTAYTWSISSGGAITAGFGTNSVTVTWTTAGARWIAVDFTSASGCTAAAPTVLNVTVTPNLQASVQVTASANPVCQGTTATFTATPTNGGSSPSYQWKVNNINSGTNSPNFSYIPANSDQVKCVMTSNYDCPAGNPAPTSNTVYMAVSQNLPVSVSVSASPAGQVCDGTQVTFTATPVNGGPSPVYQWKVNGTNAGTNNYRYTYTPLNGDIVSCSLTSNTPCSSGNPATSMPVTMSVVASIPVSVSITASTNPVCKGSQVTYTANPVNEGANPTYQWVVNGVGSGTNSPVFTYTPLNGDQVSCFLQSSLTSCTTNNPAESNKIPMTVYPIVPVSVSIDVSADPVCDGTPVTFTAYPVNGGSGPSYQWKVNGTDAGANSPTFTYTPVNNDLVSCILSSTEPCPTGNPATSSAIRMTVYQILPVSVSITASANPVCAGSTVTLTAHPVNGGTLPIYEWYLNGSVVGGLGSTFTYIPSAGDQVQCRLTSYLNCTTGNPAYSNVITMGLDPELPVSISITASENPFCQGRPVQFTAIEVNGGASPSYQWQVNGINAGSNNPFFSYLPSNGDGVTCILTSDANCATGNPATSNTIVMTMNPDPPLPVTVSVAASSNPVCTGTSVTFTASPVNGGPGPLYQWKVNGVNAGINSSTYTYTPADGDLVYCLLTSDAPCTSGNPATSNTVTMNVSPFLPVSVTVSESANPCCLGAIVTFTATPINGGSSPSYQWRVNGINAGTNSSAYTYTPANNDIVSCILTSNQACANGNPATSNAVTMTVNSDPVSVSIAASANPVCPGTPVTFTAIPVNGGSSAAYQWKVNGNNAGTDSPNFTFTPANGDVVSCILSSNAPCPTGSPATSNTVFMTVNPALTVSVGITASENPVCSGSLVSFNAIPVNGGSAPVYQWQVNGINSGTNSSTFSYQPSDNDLVSCILSSSYPCPTGNPATSNVISMSVTLAMPVSVSISASANPICEGSPVSFTATAVNGGISPAYQWKVNGVNAGTNSPGYTYLPVNNDLVSCILTSSLSCSTGSPAGSNLITVSVLPYLPVSVTISASANPVCDGSTVNFTAIPVNGGSSPSYQWQVNSINAGTNSSSFSYQPSNNDLVTCILLSSYSCPSWNPATSNTITMTVNPVQPVSVTVNPSLNPACEGTTVSFTAIPVNGGSAPSYQWQVNGIDAGTNSSTFSYPPLNNDIVSCILTSNASCPVPNPATSSLTMTMDPYLPVSVSISASANPVCSGSSVTFNAAAVNGGSNPVYEWMVNGVSSGTNSPTFNYTPNNGDLVSCILTSSYHCPTGSPSTSNLIAMTVNPGQPVSVTVSPSLNPVCTGSTVTFTATPVNGGITPSYQWKVNGSNAGTNSPTFTYTPNNGDIVFCILTSDAGCATGNPATSNQVTMQVSPGLPVSVWITANHNPCCRGSLVIFNAFPINGGASPFFQWQVNGLDAGSNSTTFIYSPINGDQVTCILTSSYLCPAANPVTSNLIAMSVVDNLGVGVSISASANPVCAGTPVTFTATGTNQGYTPVYQWKVNGVNAGTNSEFFTYAPANGDKIVCELTSSEDCTLGNPATSDPVTMTVNPNHPVSVSISTPATSICTGNPVTFNATIVNGGLSPVYQWQVNGLNSGTNSPVFTYTPANNDQVKCILTSNAICPTGNPANSNTIVLTVGPSLPVSISISSNPTGTVCAGTAVSFTAAPVNGGAAPVYNWKVNGNNVGTNSPAYTYTPANNDLVKCILTSDLACASGSPATSGTLTMIVNQFRPVSVTISSPVTSVCAGTTVTCTASPVNGGSAPSYQWQVNGIDKGTNSPSFSFQPLPGDQVLCILTSNYSCPTGNPANSNPITFTVNPNLPVSVIISSPLTTLCQGAPASFTATPVNGGLSPSYQWKVNNLNAGANSPTFNYIPNNGDIVSCILTSNAICAISSQATSNTIPLSVVPSLPVSCTISTPAGTLCQGTTATFTAIPVNGGITPSYQWQVNSGNAGTNSPTFTFIPANNDIVSCILTSGYGCPSGNPATSNPITMNVTPSQPVSVTVSASANPVCEGNQVTFSANPVNGGPTPFYQWKVNGNNAGSDSPVFTYSPSNNDAVSCILTSNTSCPSGNPSTSNIITITANPWSSVSVSINPSANPVCQGTTATFTASPVNGGLTPSYQWMVNGSNAGTDSPIFNYTPANNDLVSCRMSSSLSCPSGNPANSNVVPMTVNPELPASISINASANPSCPGSLVSFTASPQNGGSTPAYQWKVNGSDAGTNLPTFTFIPASGDVVSCILTSSENCISGNPAASNNIIVSNTNPAPVSVSITSSANPVCQGAQVTFTASPVNGGASPVYQWKVNGSNAGTNSSTFSYQPSNNDVVTCKLTSSYGCPLGNPATSNTLFMAVSPALPVSVTVSASPPGDACEGEQVTFTASPVYGGSAPSYQWKVNGIDVGANNYRYTYVPLNGDVVTCVLTSNTPCSSGNPATSPPVPMTVSPNIPVSITISASATVVCAGASITFNATAVNGGSTPFYQWVVNGTGAGTNSPVFAYTPSNGDQVSCYLLSSIANCAVNNPAPSNVIPITVYSNLAVSVIIAATANPVCQGSTVTYTADPVHPGSAPHYQWVVNGLNAGTNSSTFIYQPSDNDQVSCILTSSYPCPLGSPATSNAITMTVYQVMPVSVSIAASENPACTGNQVTFTATPVNGGSLPIYEWYVNGTVVGGMGSAYSYIPSSGDQVSCRLTSYLFCTSGNPASSNVLTMTVNPELPVSVNITASQNPFCLGTLITFNATAVNGGSAPVYQWLVNGSVAGTNSPLFSYVPSNGDAVTCVLASTADCAMGSPATSNTIVMLLNPDPPLPVSVSISVSLNPVCHSNPVIFQATPTNEGSTPVYQWQVNGINQGTSSTVYSYIPNNGDQVVCILTSGSACATGNPATSNMITIVKEALAVSLDLCNNKTTHDARAFTLGIGTPLGGTWSGVGVAGDIFTPSSVPLNVDFVNVTYTYTNTFVCTASATQVIQLFPPGGGFICKQTLTDVRNGNTYATQLIGTQCWMAKNLDFGTFTPYSAYQTNNCLAEKYCYDDLPGNCTLTGGLYQWDELMQYQSAPGSQGLCPPNWHVPSEAEWFALESNLSGQGNAGDSLKSGGSSGFNALLPGVLYSKTTWAFPGFATFFWTATTTSASRAIAHSLNQFNKSVSDYPALRSNAFSVRCVKD